MGNRTTHSQTVRQFLTGAELARRVGLHHATAKARLTSLGIPPDANTTGGVVLYDLTRLVELQQSLSSTPEIIA